jgi:hypothetical protein
MMGRVPPSLLTVCNLTKGQDTCIREIEFNHYVESFGASSGSSLVPLTEIISGLNLFAIFVAYK